MRRTIFILLVLTIFFSACKKGEEQAPAQTSKETPKANVITDRLGTPEDLKVTQDEIKKAVAAAGSGMVGVLPCTMTTEYHFSLGNSTKKALSDYGFKVQLVDPETKPERQITALENFTAAGAKAIVVCVLDPKVLASALAEVASKGVYIVQVAGRESVTNGIGISIDDADLGRAAGEYAAKLINEEMGGKANIAILDFPDLPNCVIRANNIEAALKEKVPQATILGRYLGAWQENGLKSMESALQAHPDINVVVSINDAGAYGAMQALETAKKDPAKTIIVGIDAEKKALELIRKGGMFRGTVYTQPVETGWLAAEGVVKLLSGSPVPKEVKVPVKVITKEDLKK